MFENFYFPEDTETLNVYGKNLIYWLKCIRTPYMPLHMAAEKLRRELKPCQDRTRTLSHGLSELENQLASRGFSESNLAVSLFPLTTNKFIERRSLEEAENPMQQGEIIESAFLISKVFYYDILGDLTGH
jgi:hypothetical protein